MNVSKLSRFVIAAALLAVVGVSSASIVDRGEYGNLTREQALKLARPLGNAGDPDIRDMPVVLGR